VIFFINRHQLLILYQAKKPGIYNFINKVRSIYYVPMRVIQYLLCGFLLSLLVQVDTVIASDSDTEPVLIYIDPVTGKYRMGSPSGAAVTASTVDAGVSGASIKLETISDIGSLRTVIIGIIICAWLLITYYGIRTYYRGGLRK